MGRVDIDTDEEAVILKRLYLDKGMKPNTVEMYKEHVYKMHDLKLQPLKLLYVIYNEILIKIESRLSKEVLDQLNKKSKDSENVLLENEKLTKYINSRILENNLDNYLNDNWREKLVLIEDELDTYFLYELLDIHVKCVVMKELVETFITIKDEYWLPSSLKIVLNIATLGYSIEEKKERIWQPKTG